MSKDFFFTIILFFFLYPPLASSFPLFKKYLLRICYTSGYILDTGQVILYIHSILGRRERKEGQEEGVKAMREVERKNKDGDKGKLLILIYIILIFISH